MEKTISKHKFAKIKLNELEKVAGPSDENVSFEVLIKNTG